MRGFSVYIGASPLRTFDSADNDTRKGLTHSRANSSSCRKRVQSGDNVHSVVFGNLDVLLHRGPRYLQVIVCGIAESSQELERVRNLPIDGPDQSDNVLMLTGGHRSYESEISLAIRPGLQIRGVICPADPGSSVGFSSLGTKMMCDDEKISPFHYAAPLDSPRHWGKKKISSSSYSG